MNRTYVALFDDNLEQRKRLTRSEITGHQMGMAAQNKFKEVPISPRLLVVDGGKHGGADIQREPGFVAGAASIPTSMIQPTEASSEAGLSGANHGRFIAGGSSKYCGNGCRVAILDTGIDASHAAFEGIDISETDFTGEGGGDLNGHGTHCAGIFFGRDIDGLAIGVAPNVSSVFAGKVLDGSGSGTTEGLFTGLLASVFEAKANVISVSIQYRLQALIQEFLDAGLDAEVAANQAFKTTMENVRLFEKFVELARLGRPEVGDGAIIICAAGNQSKRQLNSSHIIPAAFPSNVHGVISTAALGRKFDKYSVAPFSNSQATLSAPGVDILSASAGGGLTELSGTSMACPYVAGAAAQWWEKATEDGVPSSGKLDLVIGRLIGGCKTDTIDKYTFSDCGAGLVQLPD